jgi:hypothetical protein
VGQGRGRVGTGRAPKPERMSVSRPALFLLFAISQIGCGGLSLIGDIAGVVAGAAHPKRKQGALGATSEELEAEKGEQARRQERQRRDAEEKTPAAERRAKEMPSWP